MSKTTKRSVNVTEKEMNIDICLLPLTLEWVSPLLTVGIWHFLHVQIHSHLIWGKKGGKKCWFSKKTGLLMAQNKGKNVCTHSRTIFPFTHGPVQLVCSPQSIIFTAVTDGWEAYCNYSYRYWGHLEVVSPCWKIELLSSFSQRSSFH